MSDFFEAIETADAAGLAALQLQRLKASLAHAWRNVAPLRRKFERAGVRPEDLATLADLARFPFTTKADLRDAYPFGLFAVPRERILRLHASSGTTGKPTVVGYTRADLDTWANIMARSIHAAGGRPGDLLHNANGYGMFTGGLGFHYGAERLGCTVVPMSGGQTEKQVQHITEEWLRTMSAKGQPPESHANSAATVAGYAGAPSRGDTLRTMSSRVASVFRS